MNRIQSFCVDHDYITPGIYISRIDGDVTTYDLRTRKPNEGDYMDNVTMHSVEHMFATYVRNSELGDPGIYFGPMGCRTGFYFLTRGISHNDAIRLMADAIAFTASYEGAIPGASAIECGNWEDHDLEGARQWAAAMAPILADWCEARLTYPA